MKVAVLGYGTVGVGVYEMLEKASGLEPGPVLVRPGKNIKPFMVTSVEEIINDDSIGAVAEVMGGIEPAFSYVSAALKAGKHVVTSNKALVAAHGIELDKTARENNAAFLFSAACGGGVPFLHNLTLAAESDEIEYVGGILNGTTNYMLDSIQRFGKDYAEALSDAQELGYAEKDPTADVSGLDALRKIMLACAVAYGRLPTEGLDNEGIESITAADAAHFMSLGYTCRLVTSGALTDEGVQAYVEPVLFGPGAPECAVLTNFNLAKYCGRSSGLISMIGQGAGRFPTASAVVRDLSSVLSGSRSMMKSGCVSSQADNSTAKHNYYIRVSAKMAHIFDIKQIFGSDNEMRFISQPISVSDMHRIAKELRSQGEKIFFAAISEQ